VAMDVQGGSSRTRGGVRPSMNVTPLVDVVLVLLIIFMVITPLLTKQMWMRVPEKDDKAQAPPPAGEPTPPLVVTVEADGVRINAETIPEAELPTRLARVISARADRVIFFDAGDDVPYGRAVEVMDLARGAGALTIAVLPERPPGR